jgi:hypothetical protein
MVDQIPLSWASSKHMLIGGFEHDIAGTYITFARKATMTKISCILIFAFLAKAAPGNAWNVPGHMLSAAIAFQVLQQESPRTIEKVKAALEKHTWYANQWQARLQDVPVADHGLVVFMRAARWPDDIRIKDKQHHRGPWH